MLSPMLVVEEMSGEKEKQTTKVLLKFLCLEKMNVCTYYCANTHPVHVAISTQIFDCKSGSSACCWHLKRYQVFTKDSGIQPLGTRNDKASVDVEIFRSGQK